VARRIEAELDVLVVRKMGAPQSEELAIGAVTADGGLFLKDEIIRWIEVVPEYVIAEAQRQRPAARLSSQIKESLLASRRPGHGAP
jgi:putative phosphoribosyl transferase